MSCTGKRQVYTSWISRRSVCFLQKCAWNVLIFKEYHVKTKSIGFILMFSYDVIEFSNC